MSPTSPVLLLMLTTLLPTTISAEGVHSNGLMRAMSPTSPVLLLTVLTILPTTISAEGVHSNSLMQYLGTVWEQRPRDVHQPQLQKCYKDSQTKFTIESVRQREEQQILERHERNEAQKALWEADIELRWVKAEDEDKYAKIQSNRETSQESYNDADDKVKRSDTMIRTAVKDFFEKVTQFRQCVADAGLDPRDKIQSPIVNPTAILFGEATAYSACVMEGYEDGTSDYAENHKLDEFTGSMKASAKVTTDIGVVKGHSEVGGSATQQQMDKLSDIKEEFKDRGVFSVACTHRHPWVDGYLKPEDIKLDYQITGATWSTLYPKTPFTIDEMPMLFSVPVCCEAGEGWKSKAECNPWLTSRKVDTDGDDDTGGESEEEVEEVKRPFIEVVTRAEKESRLVAFGIASNETLKKILDKFENNKQGTAVEISAGGGGFGTEVSGSTAADFANFVELAKQTRDTTRQTKTYVMFKTTGLSIPPKATPDGKFTIATLMDMMIAFLEETAKASKARDPDEVRNMGNCAAVHTLKLYKPQLLAMMGDEKRKIQTANDEYCTKVKKAKEEEQKKQEDAVRAQKERLHGKGDHAKGGDGEGNSEEEDDRGETEDEQETPEE